MDLVKLFQSQNFKYIASINFRGAADSLFFEVKQQSFGLATPEEMFALSLNRVDRLRLISANADVQHRSGQNYEIFFMVTWKKIFFVQNKSTKIFLSLVRYFMHLIFIHVESMRLEIFLEFFKDEI